MFSLFASLRRRRAAIQRAAATLIATHGPAAVSKAQVACCDAYPDPTALEKAGQVLGEVRRQLQCSALAIPDIPKP